MLGAHLSYLDVVLVQGDALGGEPVNVRGEHLWVVVAHVVPSWEILQ